MRPLHVLPASPPKKEARGHFKEDPQPLNSCIEKERLSRTCALILETIPLKEKQAIELACGKGALDPFLTKEGAVVTAINLAKEPLSALQGKERLFDIALALDLIGYLPPKEYRLFFQEVAALAKREGWVVISTPLDIDSDDALQRFVSLAQTELTIEKIRLSHHALFLRLYNFLKWASPFLNPIKNYFNSSLTTLLFIEKICRTLSHERGVSHIILIGKIKPLEENAPPLPPLERTQKKQVWE